MDQRLIVKQVGGEIVGDIRVDSAGKLHVRALRPDWASAFHLIAERVAAGGIVRLSPAREISRVHQTRATAERPGSVGFLGGLADAITRSGERLDDRLLRAWVEND